MRGKRLRSVTVYFSTEEYEQVCEEATDHGVTVSAYVRARLGYKVVGRGAPSGRRRESRDETSCEPASLVAQPHK